MARLDGIQRNLTIIPSYNLVMLERKLQTDLSCVLSQEEELWALKSGVIWMMFSYCNTSFYHISTLVRRKRNTISVIMSNTGEWMHEESEMKEVIWNGFSDLYSTSHISALLYIPPTNTWQTRLTDEDRDNLEANVTDEEIKVGIWSLKAFKTPGPNSLHAGFFQCFWLIVARSVLEEVKKVFLWKEVPKFLNRTLISLIPKIPGSETLNNYHPINLCNTVYKVVSKILVVRLRLLLGQVISPF